MKNKWKWSLIGTAGLFAADQLVKTYAEQSLDEKEEKELRGSLILRRVHNTGMCMELLSDRPAAVRGLSAAASCAVTLFQIASVARRRGFLKKAGYTLMSAGAWSNTFDRFVRGHVVDYLGFSLKDPKLAKITYNLADFYIAGGAAATAAASLFRPEKRKKDEKKKLQ